MPSAPFTAWRSQPKPLRRQRFPCQHTVAAKQQLGLVVRAKSWNPVPARVAPTTGQRRSGSGARPAHARRCSGSAAAVAPRCRCEGDHGHRVGGCPPASPVYARRSIRAVPARTIRDELPSILRTTNRKSSLSRPRSSRRGREVRGPHSRASDLRFRPSSPVRESKAVLGPVFSCPRGAELSISVARRDGKELS